MHISFTLVIILYFFPPIIKPTDGWSFYEKSIRLGKPSKNGMFEFDLEINPKLTMSGEERGELSIFDFEPDAMVWTERDKNQLRPCLARQVRFSGNNQSIETLLGLVQLHGRHQRLNAINGQIPGPTLVVLEGAEVVLRIKNRLLLESVAIHLHGQTMHNNWFQDGVAPLQQCPVAVRSDFEVHFTAHPAGTHWYHGQFPNGHQSDGLLGALIVLPRKEEEQVFQKDFVALLQDWPSTPTWEQEDRWEEGNAEFARGMHGEFDGRARKTEWDDGVWAILINSKGWHSRSDIRQSPHRLSWSTFRVSPGDQIRLRIIHGGYQHPLVIHIDQHQMEVIAIDGAEVRPTGPLDAIIVHPGERYDVRVVAFREPTRPFYYMMVGLAEQFMDQPRDNSIYGLAKLEYGGEATEQSWDGGKKADLYLGHCRIDQHCFLLGCPFRSTNESSSSISTPDGRNFVCSSGNELISTNPKYLLTDSEKDLDMEWHRIELDPEAKTVNGYRFEFPKAKRPFFVPGTNAGAQNCSTKCDGKQKPCSCFYYKSFPLNKIIQITFVNKIPSRSSPSSMVDSFRHSVSIHLHGTHFQVTRTIVPQIGNTTRTLMEANGFLDEISGDKGSPVWKDTVMVPYGGQTVIRFMAKNPGWWLAESQQNGRGAIRFAFVIGDEQQKIPMPPWGFPADCGTFDPGEDIYSEFEQKGTI